MVVALCIFVPMGFGALWGACFEELWRICPLGQAQTILSAGTYANRPPSQHALGRAMDIDTILWAEPICEVFMRSGICMLEKHRG